jgi:hypothetical protein
VKKCLGPLYSEWPKVSGPTIKRSLGQKIIFCVFPYFWNEYNNLQWYSCWKCKKRQKSTHLTVQIFIKVYLSNCAHGMKCKKSSWRCVPHIPFILSCRCARLFLLSAPLSQLLSVCKVFWGKNRITCYHDTMITLSW